MAKKATKKPAGYSGRKRTIWKRTGSRKFKRSEVSKNANNAPVMAPIADVVVHIGEMVAFTVQASDPDLPDDFLMFSLDSGPGDVDFDGNFWWQTQASDEGAHSLVFRVTDMSGNSDTGPCTITVTNSPPVLSAVANQTIGHSQMLSFIIQATDDDLPFDLLNFSKISGPGNVDPDGTFWWQPQPSDVGLHTLQFRVRDSAGATDDGQCTINVTNAPPVLSAVGNQTIGHGKMLTFTIQADDADLPYDLLIFSKVSGPGNVDPDGTFWWQPPASDVGTHTLRYQVTDSAGASDTGQCQIRVTNDPPLMGPLSDVPVNVGEEVNFTVQASDPDLPDDFLIFTQVSGPGELDFFGNFSWTPTAAGTFPVMFKVTDLAGDSDSAGCTITVT